MHSINVPDASDLDTHCPVKADLVFGYFMKDRDKLASHQKGVRTLYRFLEGHGIQNV